MADILEVPLAELSLATAFRQDIPYWDSLKGFATIVMLQEDYEVAVEVYDFLLCHTIGDLFAKVGKIIP